MALKWFRLRGRGLKRKRGRFWAVWVQLRPHFQYRKVVPLSQAEEFREKLKGARRGGYAEAVPEKQIHEVEMLQNKSMT